MKKYKLKMLHSDMYQVIKYGFTSVADAEHYARMEGDHILDYKVEVDDLVNKRN